jgi:predicted Zn-dependent peptidase
VRLRRALGLLALGCGGAEAESVPVLDFETRPTCPAADATCLNAGTTTLDVEGVRVIYKPLPGHPLVSFRLAFDAPIGSGRQRWAETLALSMFDRGGPRGLAPSDWDSELTRLGASVGAGNGFDYGSIGATAPVVNWRELWDLVIQGIAQYRNYDFELENHRGIFDRDFQSELDDPDSAASIDAWSRLFQGHAYNYQREYLDALADLSSLDIDVAWSELSESGRWLVSVVGDLGVDEITAAVEDARGRLARSGPGLVFQTDLRAAPPAPPPVRVLDYPEAPTWYVVGYFEGPGSSSPDLAPLELGLTVLDQRLFDEVRDARGLAYTTGASLSSYRQSFGRVWITSEAPLEALAVSRQILSDLKVMGPTEGELEAARSALITRLLASNDTPSSIAATLADWELTTGAREALDDYLVSLEQATPTTVASVLDGYLRGVRITAAGGGSPLTESDLESWFVSP